MFNPFARTAPTPAPSLRRVLIVDPQEAGARRLAELARAAGGPQTWAAGANAKALKLAAKGEPELICCALADGPVDGLAFTRALRRSELACRKAPVVLLTASSTAASLLAARDAGAHEVLRQPCARKDVLRRIEAALSPRGWVEAVDYVGPDRRRFNSAEFDGPLKRLADQPAPPSSVRIGEALKIVLSALDALEREPRQALRALLAQSSELAAAAAETSDHRLAVANDELHRGLLAGGALDPAELRRRAQALITYAAQPQRAAA